jgi:hypothetical protein
MCALALLLALLMLVDVAYRAKAEMYDVIEPRRLSPLECKRGCATWADLAGSGNSADQTLIDRLWQHGAPPANVGSSCAQPGRAVNFTGLSTFTKPTDCPHMLPGEWEASGALSAAAAQPPATPKLLQLQCNRTHRHTCSASDAQRSYRLTLCKICRSAAAQGREEARSARA